MRVPIAPFVFHGTVNSPVARYTPEVVALRELGIESCCWHGEAAMVVAATNTRAIAAAAVCSEETHDLHIHRTQRNSPLHDGGADRGLLFLGQ